MMLLTILGSLALAVKIQVTAMTKALATKSRATAPISNRLGLFDPRG
ncbi:hypothetical protein QFZ34_001350 [Phyllobacterium ifriqiyense]|uniref:Uncharacterized protein n=1 Tax=Phyllobacterium ifriqiyense TaxID=314238 RepID=A0ABU0S8V9_9HYPH|nr:hypothetical protein [Phyllobacterium ifriqiyense]